jgi:hypothetical protein
MESDFDETCKPFRRTFEEQLELVTDLEWFDADAMLSVLPEVEELLDARGFIGAERKGHLMGILEKRIEDIRRAQLDARRRPSPRRKPSRGTSSRYTPTTRKSSSKARRPEEGGCSARSRGFWPQTRRRFPHPRWRKAAK